MAFIRNRDEERTGYQNGLPVSDTIDNRCDFVMVYGINESTAERISAYKERGYKVHLMTGISWGGYQDYLYGKYDGQNHEDEAQTDRFGNKIVHGPTVPYMVPTLSFTRYITESLKKAVDYGVEAIHVEEPEFWDRAGYSEAFKTEFELYYSAPWTAPHESIDAYNKCARLKAYLFARCIDIVSAELKAYAKKKYNRSLRFYVPTHSLVNYTQWEIVSPEGKLADIPGVDGCIAQVWTGTSREKNWFEGELRERTFETAFLEYGVMQELVKGTGKKMWFLHDPIEDNPAYDWDDYRSNYLKTVTASLLHGKINIYEICPWPNRVFEASYPSESPDAKPIPPEYATLLNNMFNTLGDMECAQGEGISVGVLTADSELYQRTYPDCCFTRQAKKRTGTVLSDEAELSLSFKNTLFKESDSQSELMLDFMSSSAFPGFFSLALPLVKHGVGVRPVLSDNVRRYADYLDDCDVIVMSYEFMKPDFPDINASLARWVMSGGTLIYVGNGFDPYNNINSWWTGKYKNPAEHLFGMLGIEPQKEKEIFTVGKGKVGVWLTNPCTFSFSKENSESYREFVQDTAENRLTFGNRLELKRGKYIVSGVLDESGSAEPAVYTGLFADMYTEDFAVVTQKTVHPGEKSLLCDLNCIEEEAAVIGTSLRVFSMEDSEKALVIKAAGAGGFTAKMRIKVPFVPKAAEIDGVSCKTEYDEKSKTVLLSFESKVGERTVEIIK